MARPAEERAEAPRLEAPRLEAPSRFDGGGREAAPAAGEKATAAPAAGSAPRKSPLIQLGTRCRSPDEFIERFAPFVDDEMLSIPSSAALAPGTDAQFVIRLVDHAVAMRGRCKVLEVKPMAQPTGRVVMRVRIVELDDVNRQVHGRLVARRKAAASAAAVTAAMGVPAPVRAPAASGPAAAPPQAPALAIPPPSPAPSSKDTARSAPPPPPPPPFGGPPRPPSTTLRSMPGPPPPLPLPPATAPVASSPSPPVAPPPFVASPPAPAPFKGRVPTRALGAAPLPALTPVPIPVPPASAATPAPPPAPTPPPALASVSGTAATVMMRAPGASFQLPANPLSGLESDDLASFIDCALIEGDSTTPPAEAIPAFMPATASGARSAVVMAAQPEDDAPPVRVSQVVSAEPELEPGPEDAPPVRILPEEALVPATVPPTVPMPAPRARFELRPATRRRLIAVAPYAVCAIAGLVVGIVLRAPRTPTPVPEAMAATAPRKPAVTPTPVTKAAPAPVAVAKAAPAPAPAAKVVSVPAPAPVAKVAPAPAPRETPAPREAPALAPTAMTVSTRSPAAPAAAVPSPAKLTGSTTAAAPAASGSCVASIATTPDGAEVRWGTRVLGASPLRDVAVPCGPGTVSISHDRYRAVQRAVAATPGAPAVVEERLRRPPGVLVLTALPARARFTLNGQEIGPGPRRLDVMRFETVRVEATLAGYEPWRKTIYVREETTKLNAQLVPAPKRGR